MNFAICRMDGGAFFLRNEEVLLLKKWPGIRKIDKDTRSNKFSGNSNEEEEDFLDFERRSNADNLDIKDFASEGNDRGRNTVRKRGNCG